LEKGRDDRIHVANLPASNSLEVFPLLEAFDQQFSGRRFSLNLDRYTQCDVRFHFVAGEDHDRYNRQSPSEKFLCQ
jgi:hypothetical protein